MKFISAYYLLPLFPALILSTRQGYEELERQLKEVFKERSNILRQLSKTSKELDGIKVNLESLKNDEASAKNDVKKLLELGQKQREEMKSLQEAFQKQLNEATEKAEKQQATINFLKTEVERKSKMIRDLQNENKSLKNKLLSGSKLCGIHAEESKKIQAQLKELRYGKKDLVFKAQQLTDLEQKLAIAKDELEKAALDEESQLKALKETVQLCLSSVLHNQSPVTRIISSNPTERRTSPSTNDSRVPVQVSNTEPQQSASENKGTLEEETTKEENPTTHKCDSQDAGKACLVNHRSSSPSNKTTEGDPTLKKLNIPPWIKPEPKKITEKNLKNLQEIANTKEKAL
ncbi:leucine zipper protein 2 isoform X3 [Tachyglossus aculeatus]|uniref:leucine zipper protein 2 isoform X3 n=1 Tax=Tachyglossus aculeatus TaxID=9261 RepID=UPI0018F6300E|nr:leucine zipper protein 2 isoform X3 [Tachyglossus aculeatus]